MEELNHLLATHNLQKGFDYCVTEDYYDNGIVAVKHRLTKTFIAIRNNSASSKIHIYTLIRLSFWENLINLKIFKRGYVKRILETEAKSLMKIERKDSVQTSVSKEIKLSFDEVTNTATSVWMILLILCLSIYFLPVYISVLSLLLNGGLMLNVIWNYRVHKMRIKILKELLNELPN